MQVFTKARLFRYPLAFNLVYADRFPGESKSQAYEPLWFLDRMASRLACPNVAPVCVSTHQPSHYPCSNSHQRHQHHQAPRNRYRIYPERQS